jgi:signal transduction histidine kinase
MSSPEREDPDSVEQRLLDQYLEVTQLAGALAHEIKNPLSVIRMNMDLVAEDLVAEEVGQTGDQGTRRLLQKVDVVRSQCHRLQTLLDDFLKFVRINKLDLKAGSLNEQLQRVLDFIAPKAREQGIEVNEYLDADLPTILIDAPRLYAALLNLVLNAVQAIPDGGTLVVRTRLTPAGVAADLIDDGCGMGQDTALHMFEPFYTTKEDGSGLGLPIARRIIEAHGGRIAVQSEVGQGTQFTLEFPMPARITDMGNDEITK